MDSCMTTNTHVWVWQRACLGKTVLIMELTTLQKLTQAHCCCLDACCTASLSITPGPLVPWYCPLPLALLVLTCGSRMTPGCLLYQSRVRPTLGWMTLTPACAAAAPCTKLHTRARPATSHRPSG
jgi:hypothetical protein